MKRLSRELERAPKRPASAAAEEVEASMIVFL